jgi:hypothetical protein
MNLDELARSLHVFEPTDISAFQRRARVLQSMWRQEHGIDPGEHRGPAGTRILGSRLPMPRAEQRLENFLTDAVREVVRAEVCDPDASAGKLYGKPRIFDDLLSSQPLCFNLFGELTRDLSLASKAVASLTGDRLTEVSGIEFEVSPGRGDPHYLDDRSAFDVFVRCRNAAGQPCFIGVEVKYHENLIGTASGHKARYDEVADLMGCFREDRSPLMAPPLQQVWRDHLLAGITRIQDGYGDGLFVTLYPKDNGHVSDALERYAAQLTDTGSFAGWTLEDFVGALRRFSDATWIGEFADRYLAFDKIDQQLGASD